MKKWETKFKMISSVYLVLVNDKDEVLLLRRQNTGYKDGELGLPAGHVDGGETIISAMRREAREEVGVDIDEDKLELVHVMHRDCDDHERVDFFFRATDWQGEVLNTEPQKCSELCWANLDDLPEEVIDYYKQMFAHVAGGSVYSHFGWE